MRRGTLVGVVLALAHFIGAPAAHALGLAPVVATGLTSPTFVGHAGDDSGRLFILEQGGAIRVLQPGASESTLFLDIRSRVLAGGERGLLGLAFHPLYRSNGRFFVYYTRNGDGALVIAEYRVSTDRNRSDQGETVLLTIPHPVNSNHNGGMLAFGPGGYLYTGVGDGGSGNDPPDNAQNVESLLGKILRIDVDQRDAAAGTLYSSPSSNPFVGRSGRDEIFAFGFRNPWRFSFDRETAQLWVGDVGQNAREEVDTPIIAGANYGWRVYEGSLCTNVDPSRCTPGNYTRPLFEYAHGNGRCSITGGYVYRGAAGTLPSGTYIYADFCSGEIFAWDGVSQRLLLETGEDVASFGEDEQGELYVVSLSGRISRLVSAVCTYAVSRTSVRVNATGAPLILRIETSPACSWTASTDVPWISISDAVDGTGSGTVRLSIARLPGRSGPRSGTLTIAGQAVSITQSGSDQGAGRR